MKNVKILKGCSLHYVSSNSLVKALLYFFPVGCLGYLKMKYSASFILFCCLHKLV